MDARAKEKYNRGKKPVYTSRERAHRRRFYRKNRERIKEVVARYKERTGYYLKWYAQDAEFIKARMRLWRVCRPDRERKRGIEYMYGINADSILFDEVVAKRLDAIYKERLKELRILFGRDPNTGRKKREEEG